MYLWRLLYKSLPNDLFLPDSRVIPYLFYVASPHNKNYLNSFLLYIELNNRFNNDLILAGNINRFFSIKIER